MATEELATCSFCLKPSTEVGTLVAGPGVFICDECLGLCNQLIPERPGPKGRAPVRRFAPWDAESGLDAVLAALPRVAQAGNQAEYTLTRYVRKARELGATWAVIGQSLGMTRQSAWERFSGEE
jgi:ClpX C4-type zinc finger